MLPSSLSSIKDQDRRKLGIGLGGFVLLLVSLMYLFSGGGGGGKALTHIGESESESESESGSIVCCVLCVVLGRCVGRRLRAMCYLPCGQTLLWFVRWCL
jgi:hypothetical protein